MSRLCLFYLGKTTLSVFINLYLTNCTSPLAFPNVKSNSHCASEAINEVKDTVRLFLNSIDLPAVEDTSNNSRPILVTEVIGVQQGSPWDDKVMIRTRLLLE